MTQDDLYALLPFVLLALVFWLLVFRPARKRQRETTQTQANLQAGARVMLTSGIFGEVKSLGDGEIEVEIAPGTVIQVHRQAIGKVIPADEPAPVEQPDDEVEDNDEADDDSTESSVTAASETSETAGSSALPPTHQEKK